MRLIDRICELMAILAGIYLVVMMLGIVLHASQWYLIYPPAGIPMPLDPQRSYLFDVIMH